jgi:hypothetical protein
MPGRSTFPDAALRNSALRALSQRRELSPNTCTFPVLSEKRLRNCAARLTANRGLRLTFDSPPRMQACTVDTRCWLRGSLGGTVTLRVVHWLRGDAPRVTI